MSLIFKIHKTRVIIVYAIYEKNSPGLWKKKYLLVGTKTN